MNRRSAALALLVAATGCGDTTAPGASLQAFKVGFLANPAPTATAGSAISPALTVAVQDSTGATMTTVTGNVTVSITSGTGTTGATLSGTLTRPAVDGVATFDDLKIDKVGTGYTLTATAASLTIAKTTAFAVLPGAPAKLVITAQPANATSAVAIGPAIAIAVQDAVGNTVTTSTASVTVGITTATGASGAALSGTKTVSATGGVATFNDLTIDKSGTGYSLTATATGLTGAATNTFDIAAGAPSRLGVTVQPTTVVSNTAINPAVAISVQDAQGNTVPSSTASITVAITTGTGTAGAALAGTKTVAASAGVASFGTLAVDKSGSGYTLTATATGLTSVVTSAFTVNAAAATKLVFAVQPTSAVSAVAISPAIVVQVQDAQGNVISAAANSVTIAIGTNAGSGTLGGTATVAASSGVATFSNLSIDKAGTGYTLTASAPGLTSASSSAFNITVGAASKLAFIVQPTNAVSSTAITPGMQVAVQDAAGNTVTTSTAAITIAMGTNAGSGTLGGTATVAASSGVATFSTLSIDKAGTGYTLAASATSLAGATSSTFNITVGAASKLGIIIQPTDVVSAVAINPAMRVAVQDAAGNTVTTSSAAITVAIGSAPGNGTVSGTLTVSATSGLANFSNLSITKAGVGYALTATATGLASATSATFTVSAGPAVTMNMEPGNNQTATAGGPVATKPAVYVTDAGGNAVSGFAVHFAPSSGSSATGQNQTTNAGGIATVGSWTLGASAGTYTMTVTAAGLIGSPATFTATAVAAAPANLAVVRGSKIGFSSTALNTPYTAQVTDPSGNPVGGVTVTFTVTGGGGIITGGSQTTDGNGEATMTSWTMGAATSANTMTIATAGVTSVNVTVDMLTNIYAGGFNTCGLATTGNAYCWGWGAVIGDGNFSSRNMPEAVTMPTGHLFESLSMGKEDACGRSFTGGAAFCWGTNTNGVLGDNTTTDRLVPTPVAGGNNFTKLAVRGGGTTSANCGLTGGGDVRCWGTNTNGNLGTGAFTNSALPTLAATGGRLFDQLTVQGATCALEVGTGSAYCWGDNSNRNVGNDTITAAKVPAPRPVSGGFSFTRISSGQHHVCALTSGGAAYCWGNNGGGQLGGGSVGGVGDQSTPAPVSGGLTFTSLVSGDEYTCGLTSAGAAYCWGWNSQGQLGDGNSGSSGKSDVPVAVAGNLTFTGLAAGNSHTCGVAAGGRVYCWGYNIYGQLGDGTGSDHITVKLISPP